MRKNIEVLANQTLFDVTLQEYGSIEALFDLIQDNGKQGVNDSLYTAEVLTIDSTKVKSQPIVNLYLAKQINPASAGGEDEDEIGGAFVTAAFTFGFEV